MISLYKYLAEALNPNVKKIKATIYQNTDAITRLFTFTITLPYLDVSTGPMLAYFHSLTCVALSKNHIHWSTERKEKQFKIDLLQVGVWSSEFQAGGSKNIGQIRFSISELQDMKTGMDNTNNIKSKLEMSGSLVEWVMRIFDNSSKF